MRSYLTLLAAAVVAAVCMAAVARQVHATGYGQAVVVQEYVQPQMVYVQPQVAYVQQQNACYTAQAIGAYGVQAVVQPVVQRQVIVQRSRSRGFGGSAISIQRSRGFGGSSLLFQRSSFTGLTPLQRSRFNVGLGIDVGRSRSFQRSRSFGNSTVFQSQFGFPF